MDDRDTHIVWIGNTMVGGNVCNIIRAILVVMYRFERGFEANVAERRYWVVITRRAWGKGFELESVSEQNGWTAWEQTIDSGQQS